MSATLIKPVSEHLKDIAASNERITDRAWFEKTEDGLLAYVPIWFTTKGITIYPAYEGIFPTFRIRSRYWAFFDFADHSNPAVSDTLLNALNGRNA